MTTFQKVKILSKLYGISGVAKTILGPRQPKTLNLCTDLLYNKRGIEIGGPTRIFKGGELFPIYPVIRSLDNVNVVEVFPCQDGIRQHKRMLDFTNGCQYITEAWNLDFAESSAYDFVISSHALEHCANPLKVLHEWKRVLKHDGTLVLIIPDKRLTFDNKRRVTTIEHIREDFRKNTGEDDETHMEEFIALMHLCVHNAHSDEYGLHLTHEELVQRTLNNYQNRAMHQHVFDMNLAVEVVTDVGFRVLAFEFVHPFHLIVVAKKL